MLLGQHVRLQPWTMDDAPRVAEWCSAPAYLGEHSNIWPWSPALGERFMAEQAHGPAQQAYFILRRDAPEFLGTMGYWHPFARTYATLFHGWELWWQGHPTCRRQGMATHAACLLVNHLCDATPIARLQATMVVGNDASCRVAERAGMQRDGLYRRVSFLHGRSVDLHLYAIVREDWHNEAHSRHSRPAFERRREQAGP